MIPVILWSKFNKRERKDEYLVTVDNCLFLGGVIVRKMETVGFQTHSGD